VLTPEPLDTELELIFSKELLRMPVYSRPRLLICIALITTVVLSVVLSSAAFAAGSSIFQISSDPYTNSTSQHQTEVEPDSYSNGSTIVAATQVGRFSGWCCGIGKHFL
jgi:hypothetical protein